MLVESGEVKTEAFAALFRSEPVEAVRRIVRYHEQHGGISRFEKFRTIYREILQRPLPEEEFRALCDAFAGLVVERIVAAPWVAGVKEFLARHQGRYAFFVVSGTPEQELREIVRRRGITGFFVELLGAPERKERLLSDLVRRHGLQADEVVVVGDAETDWLAARRCGMRFIWRRASEGGSGLAGFPGPAIRSLTELDACLAALDRDGVPQEEHANG